jgi:hypothetical protein
VTVRFWESAAHGFLVLRNDQGGAIAHGELVQAPHREGMQSRLAFRFADGSLQEETDAVRTAVRYVVTMDLVGVTGSIATVLGKDPPDMRFWISTADAPTFPRFEGSMFLKGPRWRIELAAPRWTRDR